MARTVYYELIDTYTDILDQQRQNPKGGEWPKKNY